MAVRKKTSVASTKDAVFASAASQFSSRGFNGVSTDDIARDAGVNKAMIYYHFADKLALYRAIVCEGLQAMGETVGAIAACDQTPAREARCLRRGLRPHDGDASVDAGDHAARDRRGRAATRSRNDVAHAKGDRELRRNPAAGAAARRRSARSTRSSPTSRSSVRSSSTPRASALRSSRNARTLDLPMLVSISHDDVIAHMQEAARRMLAHKPHETLRRSTSSRSHSSPSSSRSSWRAARMLRPRTGCASRVTSKPRKRGSPPTPAAAS